MNRKGRGNRGVLAKWRKSLNQKAREEIIGLLRMMIGVTAVVQLWLSFGR